MASPTNAGIDPIARPAATITPHAAIGTGFAATALMDVTIALGRPTSRSSKSGNETTPIAGTTAATRKPTPTPVPIISHPAVVVNTCRLRDGSRQRPKKIASCCGACWSCSATTPA